VNIVIVGGGTAGWLSALFISKVKPIHSIKVIESSKIGIVGAGEGSTALLTGVVTNAMHNFGCDLEDFILKTGTGLKYGIMHKNWSGDGTQYFGPIEGTPSSADSLDTFFHFQNQSDEQNHMSSFLGYCMEKNIVPFEYFSSDPSSAAYVPYHALHFDAHAVGKYFRDVVVSSESVKHIDAVVQDVVVSPSGNIESLSLDDGSVVEGDFFIDATGFSRILMKKLGVRWHSYSKNLSMNSAMPFIVDYKDDESPKPYTTAWAHSAGWMWEIPTLDRKGCGYVFDDNFITADQAKDEIESSLGHEIEPIRVLKFDTGRQEVLWKNNCLSIGLGAAFAEPLEATSIHSTIVQIFTFVFEFMTQDVESMCSEANIKQYNNRMTRMYDDFKDFLVLHYQSGRNDSEFWKWISTGETKTEFVSHIIELSRHRPPGYNDFTHYFGAAGWPLWSWVLAGIGALSPQSSLNALKSQGSEGLSLDDLEVATGNWANFIQSGSEYEVRYNDWVNEKRSKR